ncbi:hypothetical protein AB4Z50_04765 [Paenibacillus sp. 2TAB26]|uniref:hypothetical protein n=1 Tax=Paenibacillus sp. 2TAB26 TaxID=3233005 RepID=UPI003F9A5245
MITLLKKIAVILLSISFSYSYSKLFIEMHNESVFKHIFIYSYLFLFGLVTITYLLKKNRMKLVLFNKKIKIIIAMSCLLISSIVILKIPVDMNKEYGITHITVNAIGEMNPDSKGSEVWLTELEIDGQIFVLSTLDLQGNWIVKDKAIVSQGTGEPLILNISAKKSIHLKFGTHAWSGKVLVSHNNTEQKVDLYSPESGKKEVLIQPIGKKINMLSRILIISTFTILLSLIILFLSLIINKRLKRYINKFRG